MAILDSSFTRSFFSEIAHSGDICYYCEKAVREERDNGKLSFDDFIKKIKELTGALEGKRVAKLKYVGHEFCICPDCLENIINEVIAKDKHKEAINEILDAAKNVEESVAEESATEEKTKSKTKTKGK